MPTAADDVSIYSPATGTGRAGDAESIDWLGVGVGGSLLVKGGAVTVGGKSANAGSLWVLPGASMSVGGGFSELPGAALLLPSSGVPTNPTANLLANPDFTSSVDGSTPSAWSAWNASVSGAFAYAGSQSLAMSGPGAGAYQSFSVAPGAAYTLSVDAMMPASDPFTGSEGAYIQLEFYDANGQQLTGYTPPNAVTVLTASSAPGGPLAGSVGDQGWTHFSTTAVAPATAATVSAILVVGQFNGSGPGGGTVYWGDAQFGPAIAEPATFSAGNILNAGLIDAGPRSLVTADGAYAQTSTATLQLNLGGVGYNGALSVGKPPRLWPAH